MGETREEKGRGAHFLPIGKCNLSVFPLVGVYNPMISLGHHPQNKKSKNKVEKRERKKEYSSDSGTDELSVLSVSVSTCKPNISDK
jgi:hypothetical protein